MYDQRNVGGPGGTQVQRASAAGTPGKTTLTEQLNGGAEPMATAARHHEKKGLLDALHEALHKAAEKIRDKISEKIAEAPEKQLDKLLEKLEQAADHTIDDGLHDGAKSCLSQAEIDHVVAAINTTRLIAAFHLLDDVDKATLAEIKSLQSKESLVEKGVEFVENLGDALSALNKFSHAMGTANGHLSRLHKVVARCRARPVPHVNPQLQPFTAPEVHKLPQTIHLPPDVEHPGPPIQIHISPKLIGGGVGVGL